MSLPRPQRRYERAYAFSPQNFSSIQFCVALSVYIFMLFQQQYLCFCQNLLDLLKVTKTTFARKIMELHQKLTAFNSSVDRMKGA